MIVQTKEFFNLIHVHHRLPKQARANDLAGRLTVMADPTRDQFRITALTRRCLRLFLERRVQPSSTNQDVA